MVSPAPAPVLPFYALLLLLFTVGGDAFGSFHGGTAIPGRLTVNGSQLLDPSGNTVRLTGLNWQYKETGHQPGTMMNQVMPGANVARLVGIMWDNTFPLSVHYTSDCYLPNSPPNYFNDKCFAYIDEWVLSCQRASLWAILAMRGQYAAGQNYATDPMQNVFNNATLRSNLYAAWAHIAEHYKTWENIAAYEILSEPRDQSASQKVVREFYEGGCNAVFAVDAATPCLVGGAPYYKLWTFDADTLLRGRNGALMGNVIYTVDYFEPASYVFGYNDKDILPGTEDEIVPIGNYANGVLNPHLSPERGSSGRSLLFASVEPAHDFDDLANDLVRNFNLTKDMLWSSPTIDMYGSNVTWSCADLYVGWVSVVCPTWPGGNAKGTNIIPFNKAWHAHNLLTYAVPIQRCLACPATHLPPPPSAPRLDAHDNIQMFLRSRRTYNVPIFMNQFEVAYGVTASKGKVEYISDLLSLSDEYGLVGWAWWTGFGGNSDGYKFGSSEVIFLDPDGINNYVDATVVDALTPYFNGRTWPAP